MGSPIIWATLIYNKEVMKSYRVYYVLLGNCPPKNAYILYHKKHTLKLNLILFVFSYVND